jgi:Tol biopolymer transport system component
MPEPPATENAAANPRFPSDRLDSWKEIASYLRRDVTTVQRWEKREGMPVHRHLHDRMGSVYAFRSELDVWARSRTPAQTHGDGEGTAEREGPGGGSDVTGSGAPAAGRPGPAAPELTRAPVSSVSAAFRTRPAFTWIAFGTVVVAALAVWALHSRGESLDRILAEARFQPLTDFEGIEQAAALSRDGRFVAFQSDRDGRIEVWVTQVGTGRFTNLTRAVALELVNPSVRTLGFSPDGSLVTFWGRRPVGSAQPDISIWAAPLLGGPPRLYLAGVAEYDWSADGERLVYHTPGPGDPMFVREAAASAEARQIFSAPAGLHSHYLVWSPDGTFVVFVQGSVPDRMDLWRITPAGETPERLTHHDARVSHPVFVGRHTLLYLVSDPDGSGPWIRSLDLRSGAGHRLGSPLDRFTSLSASTDGRRLVATRAMPKTTFWRLPLDGPRADMAAASRIPLTTLNGRSPRLGPGALFYVSSRPAGDAVWKLEGEGGAAELWSIPGARVLGAAVPSGDGRQVAFCVRKDGRASLTVVNTDGTGAHEVGTGLDVQGTPAWVPDGRSLTVAALVNGGPQLFRIPLDGSTPAVLVAEHAAEPVWSPSGDLVAFSGADVGTTFPVRLIAADGSRSSSLRAPTLTRGARHLTFLPGGRALLVLRGEIGHKNLFRVNLESGAEEPVLELPPDLDVRDFDLSPDGRELVFEQVKDNSDLVLIELPRR